MLLIYSLLVADLKSLAALEICAKRTANLTLIKFGWIIFEVSFCVKFHATWFKVVEIPAFTNEDKTIEDEDEVI
ncbi:hypothetical protein WICMUC_001906 [Wickerhamomyces mucosus]|uniref:Uncharacterized protein n=1 Tax=Wickerhamomyces mucosus TaxID=1378264 RepID=A0A9P8TG48_9ASCO|nr:hypothetical protein WICMUC_001906 [Wickerhamomyces mucosus]